jgi:CRP-like cAMP-binding protein
MILASDRVNDGRDLLVSIVEGGQVYGEIAVIDGNPRSYDATTSCAKRNIGRST